MDRHVMIFGQPTSNYTLTTNVSLFIVVMRKDIYCPGEFAHAVHQTPYTTDPLARPFQHPKTSAGNILKFSRTLHLLHICYHNYRTAGRSICFICTAAIVWYDRANGIL